MGRWTEHFALLTANSDSEARDVTGKAGALNGDDLAGPSLRRRDLIDGWQDGDVMGDGLVVLFFPQGRQALGVAVHWAVWDSVLAYII